MDKIHGIAHWRVGNFWKTKCFQLFVPDRWGWFSGLRLVVFHLDVTYEEVYPGMTIHPTPPRGAAWDGNVVITYETSTRYISSPVPGSHSYIIAGVAASTQVGWKRVCRHMTVVFYYLVLLDESYCKDGQDQLGSSHDLIARRCRWRHATGSQWNNRMKKGSLIPSS